MVCGRAGRNKKRPFFRKISIYFFLNLPPTFPLIINGRSLNHFNEILMSARPNVSAMWQYVYKAISSRSNTKFVIYFAVLSDFRVSPLDSQFFSDLNTYILCWSSHFTLYWMYIYSPIVTNRSWRVHSSADPPISDRLVVHSQKRWT